MKTGEKFESKRGANGKWLMKRQWMEIMIRNNEDNSKGNQ